MEDTKINTGGTKDKEGCQILQNDNEEVVKCPECLHNFKCALCCSKNQTVQEMRSKLERDNIQIKQVMSKLISRNYFSICLSSILSVSIFYRNTINDGEVTMTTNRQCANTVVYDCTKSNWHLIPIKKSMSALVYTFVFIFIFLMFTFFGLCEM